MQRAMVPKARRRQEQENRAALPTKCFSLYLPLLWLESASLQHPLDGTCILLQQYAAGTQHLASNVWNIS